MLIIIINKHMHLPANIFKPISDYVVRLNYVN